MGNDAQTAILDRARFVMPEGHLGNTDAKVIVRNGKGGRIWDVLGNSYVDFMLGSGPMLIGHAHPAVVEAVAQQVGRGSTFFATNEHIVELAEQIVAAVPCAEKVRFTSSGSEADAYAMRLARAYRGRDKILKFEGGYHGMSDYGLQSLWPAVAGNSPQSIADSAGIPASVSGEVVVARFNDLESASSIVADFRKDLAGIIVEPMQRLIPPAQGFLQGLRNLATEYDIPLIFDEVVTGFRLHYGGAQAYYGVTPDICTLGKVLGGGYPLAAVVGRADIMAHFDRDAVPVESFMPMLGTLSGNPIAAVAGLATLKVLREPQAYERLHATGKRLMEGLRAALSRHGCVAQIIGEPPLFDVAFTEHSIRNYRDTMTVDKARQLRFNQVMLANGVFKSSGKIYVSLAHDDFDVDQAFNAFEIAAEACRPGPN